MKPHLLRCSAAAVLAAALTTTAYAEQDPAVTDRPAGETAIMPKPTVEEDLVYLKDIVALQTLRLDEAEELIAKQSALIEAQAQQINALTRTVTAMNDGAAPRFAAAGGEYQVQSGDTLSSIARRHNTTVQAMAQANNLKAPYPLRIGDTLTLPGQPEPVRIAAAPQPAASQPAAPAQSPQADATKTSNEPQSASSPAVRTASSAAPSTRPTQVAANDTQPKRDDDKRDGSLPTEVGVRPEEEDERPYLAIAADIGGILTPAGTMFVEPAIDYTVASDNRFFFQGIEIIDAVLIGAIEATDTDRRAVTESLAVKYGITSRLEVDARVPYVSRTDRISGVAIDDGTTTIRDLDGSGLGDIDFGLHYQLTNGGKWPYVIANLRAKAPTGTGPFDVMRDPDNGIETELATGSGFWTIEPSLTFILASDPASIFANVGYQFNRSVSPNIILTDTATTINELPTDAAFGVQEEFRTTLLEFDAGDAIRTSIGLGLSLNERLSMNFGYDQSFFLRSKNATEVFQIVAQRMQVTDGMGNTTSVIVRDDDDRPVLLPAETTVVFSESPATTVGSFLFGASYAVNDRLRINLNGAIGATDEAPDARVSLRAQYRLFD
ncbi:LysM peptidoglycan-binding domain-containing protein [Hyphococcus sp.]|uniref:LysM peptidoglycan-binding domain-containing protein n=1 Tax=Hyphococcus sp. TaxID=2038636 RepID=UPI003D134F12